MKRALMVSTHGYFESKPRFGLPDTGGQVTFVIALSKALARYGYKVDILTRKFEDFPSTEEISQDVRIIRIPCGGTHFIPKEYLVEQLPELVDGFIGYCRHGNLKYGFINSHYWDGGFVGAKLTKMLDTAHVFTPHSLGIWKKTEMEQSSAETAVQLDPKQFERQHNFKQRIETETTLMGQADKVIATTPVQKDIVNRQYRVSEDKIAVIPPGFDPGKFRKLDGNSLKKATDRYKLPPRFVLSIGRITPYKGHDLLVKAIKSVVQEMPDVKLVLRIGSEKPTERETQTKNGLLQMIEDLGLADNTLFYDYVEEIEAFYNAAEVFVVPSTYEPFGMGVIESMACGTPVLVTNRAGVKHFLKDGEDALFVDPLDTQTMAAAILNLLIDRSLYNKLSENGYEKAHSTFTWEMIAKSTLKAIDEL